MNGSTLALGLTAALAAAGALSQRGGRGPAFGSRAKKAKHGSVNYAVFEPQQIKSATGNSGSFDGDDARISYNRVSR